MATGPVTISALMAAQHAGLDGALARASRHLDASDLRAARADLATAAAALRRHVAVEDAHLLPAYRGLAAASAALLGQMQSEHLEIEGLVLSMEQAAAAGDRSALIAAKARLSAAMGDHDEHEEAICAALDEGLGPDARRALIAHLGG